MKYIINNNPSIYLTKREMECMYYLIRGKSMKETARFLNLSPRTVETYVEHMKNRTGCYTKTALVGMIFKSDLLQKLLQK